MSRSSQIDPSYLDLQALAAYTSISVRTWRDYLKRPDAQAVFKLPDKILVARADADAWLQRFKRQPGEGLEKIVDDVMQKFSGKGEAA